MFDYIDLYQRKCENYEIDEGKEEVFESGNMHRAQNSRKSAEFRDSGNISIVLVKRSKKNCINKNFT